VLPHELRETRDNAGVNGYIILGVGYASSSDILLIKVDNLGNVMWAKLYDANMVGQEGNAIEQTADYGYIIGGFAQDPLSNDINMLLLKVDENGDLMWNKVYIAPSDEQIYDVEQTSEGGFIFAGGVYMYEIAGHYIVKTDGNGNIEWQNEYQRLFATNIFQDVEGNYLAGGSSVNGSFMEDIFGMRMDENGGVGECPLIKPSNLQVGQQLFIATNVEVGIFNEPPEVVVFNLTWNEALGIENVPCSFMAPGAVPDNDNFPGTPLQITKITNGVRLTWGAPGGTCVTTDYGIYRGLLPNFYSHTWVVCSTGGAQTYDILDDENSYYYLVVAQNVDKEGLYGLDSANNPIPQALTPCFQQAVGKCN